VKGCSEVVEVFTYALRQKHVVGCVIYVVRHRVVRIQQGLVMMSYAVDCVRMCSNTHMKETDRLVEGLLYPCVSRSRDACLAVNHELYVTALEARHVET
jgi:hypothetical protein